MFKLISNIPIFRRLFYAFLLAAVIPGIVISILGFTFIGAQNTRSEAVQTSIFAVKKATTAGSYLPGMIGLLNVAYQDRYRSDDPNIQQNVPTILQRLQDLSNQFEHEARTYQQDYLLETSPQMATLRSILNNDHPGTTLPQEQEKAVNTALLKSWPAYKRLQTQVINGIESGLSDETVSASLEQANVQYRSLDNGWNKVTAFTEKMSDEIAVVGDSQTYPVMIATAIAFVITLLVIIAIGYVINMTITRPLRLLANLTKRISKGETSARASITGSDEIYVVANSMNNMLDNIVRLIQETKSQRDVLQGQVEKLVSEVSGVGGGDLRVQAEVTTNALGVLADSFNYMIEELSNLIVRVKHVANEVDGSTSSILRRMTQLVESGDMQIQKIAQAAIEVERMASSSRQVAERSQMLYDIARTAHNDAQLGRESVRQAIEGMRRINENVQSTGNKVQMLGERSLEINEIVEGISTIAHQTNRLALDAAIQAAMAGENGRGFRAVADDIRRLAESAKEQASEIASIVRSVREDIAAVASSMHDTQRETAAGTSLTQEAGVALESIFAAVEYQTHEIESINHMAVRQLESSSAVVKIMQGVSESTQHSSASTRDAAQNMERLAHLVEQLRASVAAFKLRQEQGLFSVPVSTVKMEIDDELENQKTVSGVFRAIPRSVINASQPDSMSVASVETRSEEQSADLPSLASSLERDEGWHWQPPLS